MDVDSLIDFMPRQEYSDYILLCFIHSTTTRVTMTWEGEYKQTQYCLASIRDKIVSNLVPVGQGLRSFLTLKRVVISIK
jgi:hypothetical protein